MEYPKCTGIDPDLPCLQHAPEKLLIAAACVLVAAEGHDHIVIKVSAEPFWRSSMQDLLEHLPSLKDAAC